MNAEFHSPKPILENTCKAQTRIISTEKNKFHPETRKHKKQQAGVDILQWYAVYTRSRFEKKMYRALIRSKLEAFLPLVKEKRVWSDRLKTVEMPLLPGYIFVKLSPDNLAQVYTYPGFVRFVAFEGKPCVIREAEIDLLQKIVEHGLRVQHTGGCTCQVGDRVRIIHGPLKDWEGCVERLQGSSRIIFQLDSIQQAISVEVECGEVEVI